MNTEYYTIQKFWSNCNLQPFIAIVKKTGLFVIGVRNTDNNSVAFISSLLGGVERVVTFERYKDAEEYCYWEFRAWDVCKQAQAHRKNLLPEQIATIIVCSEIAKDINRKK